MATLLVQQSRPIRRQPVQEGREIPAHIGLLLATARRRRHVPAGHANGQVPHRPTVARWPLLGRIKVINPPDPQRELGRVTESLPLTHGRFLSAQRMSALRPAASALLDRASVAEPAHWHGNCLSVLCGPIVTPLAPETRAFGPHAGETPALPDAPRPTICRTPKADIDAQARRGIGLTNLIATAGVAVADHAHPAPSPLPVWKAGEAKANRSEVVRLAAARGASSLHHLLSRSPLRRLGFEHGPIVSPVREVDI